MSPFFVTGLVIRGLTAVTHLEQNSLIHGYGEWTGKRVVVTYLCSTLRAKEAAPFHMARQTEPLKGSSDSWHKNWWVEKRLHKCYGSLGRESRDWQKHMQNENLPKLWLHTFHKQVWKATMNMKRLGDYALCQASCQGLALFPLQDLLQRTMN